MSHKIFDGFLIYMKRLLHLNTYSKLILLIASTSLFFFFIYALLYFYTVQEEKNFHQSTYRQYEKEIKSLFRLNSKTATATVIDVTYWDELVKYTKTKDPKWFEENIVQEFDAYEADYIGVYDLNNAEINKIVSAKLKGGIVVSKEILQTVYQSRLKRFYLKVPEGVLEMFCATIHPQSDPKKVRTNPYGYFIIARLLDKEFLDALGRISNSSVAHAPANHVSEIDENFITVALPLYDYQKQTISKLIFKRPFTLNYKNTKEILFIVFLVSILNILIYVYYTKRWVYDPLKLVKSILESKSQLAISNLKKVVGEFGYIGNLFEENNIQRLQLEKAKLKAEESDNLKSSFLANLSHEIRTPMNAIMGFSDLLEDDEISEAEKKHYLKIIKDSGTNLVSIIEDLIEMSKIDANQIVPNYTSVHLENCINELYSSLKITIPSNKNIDFQIIKNEQLFDTNIRTDETKLKQILLNLITNAIKFTDSGQISFGYTIRKKQMLLEFNVRDTGNGIGEDHRKIIFDRFRQIEGNTSPEVTGLGLGLSITKAYVEMLGGKIAVHSRLGFGSVFTFTIPLILDDQVVENDVIRPQFLERHNDKEAILIAEDDNMNFLLLKKIIQKRNFIVLRAINGEQAVKICKEHTNIRLVFMDLKMPILNGYDALKQIKVFRPNLTFVAHTAYSSNEDREKIFKDGFSFYLPKPLNKSQVFEILATVFTSSIERSGS
ncbi:MAG: ATP-binding protein [Flavobacterium sp.]